MILYRYLAKEVLYTLVAVVVVLLLIFLSQQFVRYIGYAADGRYGLAVVGHIMLIMVPHLLGVLLPLALFVSILFAYGRLYADSEMTVMMASGLGQGQLLSITMVLGLIVMCIVGVISLWLTPKINIYKHELMEQTDIKRAMQTMMPGRFQQTADGLRVVYVQDFNKKETILENIFVAQKTNNTTGQWDVIAAKNGYQETDDDHAAQFIVANNGNRYQGVPGKKDYRIIKFDKYKMYIDQKPVDDKREIEELSTRELWKLHRQNAPASAEFQWRLAMPISAVLLAMLAFPLSAVKPRKGKFGKLVPAILLYIIYANLLFAARAWVEKETALSHVGLWLVHGIFLVFILMLIAQHMGVIQRLQRLFTYKNVLN